MLNRIVLVDFPTEHQSGWGYLAVLCRASQALKRSCVPMTKTKNAGTKNIASKVPLSMPPNTPVPIACWVSALAPLASIKGTTPRVNANEVIKIGRRRKRAAVTAASISVWPSACNWRANSTMRIAFFADRPRWWLGCRRYCDAPAQTRP